MARLWTQCERGYGEDRVGVTGTVWVCEFVNNTCEAKRVPPGCVVYSRPILKISASLGLRLNIQMNPAWQEISVRTWEGHWEVKYWPQGSQHKKPHQPPFTPLQHTYTHTQVSIALLVSFSLGLSCWGLNFLPCLDQGDSSVNHATLVDLPAFLYTLITELLPQGRLGQCKEFTYKKQKGSM